MPDTMATDKPADKPTMSDAPQPVSPSLPWSPRPGSSRAATSVPIQSLPEEAAAPTRSALPLMEALYRVLVHNDDVTPFDYVTRLLARIFTLSDEIAEHIAITAHREGIAVVIIRPRSEAERLSTLANRSARQDGYPLVFTLEPDL